MVHWCLVMLNLGLHKVGNFVVTFCLMMAVIKSVMLLNLMSQALVVHHLGLGMVVRRVMPVIVIFVMMILI